MKILLLGKNGQVGWELNRSLMPLGTLTALDRTQCDLSLPETIPDIVRSVRPDVIVNAAAYTAVDQAEQEEDIANTVNAIAPGVLAEEAAALNALLVHYSTDYIFDGSKPGSYKETDRTAPINVYGRSKLAGEKNIEQSGCDHVILRTSWVYSARGSNFLRTILRLAAERKVLSIVNDQIGSPTCARHIADATSHVVLQSWRRQKTGKFTPLICNLTSAGSTSWYDFAKKIVELSINQVSMDMVSIKIKSINPVTSMEYQTAATRPLNSCLDNSRIETDFGLKMPHWETALQLCMNDINSTILSSQAEQAG